MTIAKQSRFSKVCPRRLVNLPNTACPTALLRIEFVQNGKRELPDLPGCPYYVNDVLSNYCWFCYANRDDFCSHSTREISRILSLSPAQIEKAERLALEKLAGLKGTEDMNDMRECVAALNQGNEDDTIYAIGAFTAEGIEELSRTFIDNDEPAGAAKGKHSRARKNS